jgi:hypothetical protein
MTATTPSTEDFQDMLKAVEVVLNRSFQGADITALFGAVDSRIAELEGPASEEVEFDESSLELGILKSLLASITEMGGVASTSRHLH